MPLLPGLVHVRVESCQAVEQSQSRFALGQDPQAGLQPPQVIPGDGECDERLAPLRAEDRLAILSLLMGDRPRGLAWVPVLFRHRRSYVPFPSPSELDQPAPP